MDRNSIIGIILISIVVGAWVFFQSMTSTRDVTPEQTKQRTEHADSARTAVVAPATGTSTPVSSLTPSHTERMLTVETDRLRVRLSSYGGTIRSWKLIGYHPWYGVGDTSSLVDLVHPGVREFGFSFRTMTGAKVKAKDLNFVFDAPSDVVRVSGNDVTTIRATAALSGGGTIVRTYTFHGNAYGVQTSVVFDGMENVIPATNRFVNLEWARGIRYSEGSTVDESNNAIAMISAGGSVDEMEAENYNAVNERTQTGAIDYVATRSKYFAVALMPAKGFDGTAYMRGTKFGAEREGVVEEYGIGYRLPYRGGRAEHAFTLYAGPMDYDTLKTYGLTGVMNFGLKWIVKPIGEYFMLPTLKAIHGVINNYGVAIILFSILMKLLLYPLSITQMKSAQKMQLLGPLMNEIREKYKDDQQTQNQEMMKLYSEYGINPAGGCLPLLLQMPFLYALYSVLNLNIELRQAAFLPMWLTDLSVPDVILALPFKLPLVNIDKFSGLALLMGATLFIQQKQAVTDPRQKAMVYLMPVMLTLMFSALPSGLNLYYFMFNIMGIGQQLYMTKFSKNRLTLAQLKAMPKKEGWLQRKMREAQEIAAAQGKAIPGQSNAPRQKGPGQANGRPQGKKRR